MSSFKKGQFCMDVVEIEEFLSNPPPGFVVENRGSGYRFVRSQSGTGCVFIDDFVSPRGKVIFQNSLGRETKISNLGDYTKFRAKLTSERIYLLVSACLPSSSERSQTAFQQYVVVLNGAHPLMKWEMERGLDYAISSVAGESYKVDIDLCEALQSWAGNTFHLLTDGKKVTPVWRDTCFTLKYYSDALFDFPHWLGFSKRQFKIPYHGR